MRSSWSKVCTFLDPDGSSSPLDLMKTVGVFQFDEYPSEGSTGDPGVLWSSEEPIDEETYVKQAYC